MKKIIFILAVFIGLSMQGCFIGRPHGGGDHHEGHHDDRH
jgi:hypothetical protein